MRDDIESIPTRWRNVEGQRLDVSISRRPVPLASRSEWSSAALEESLRQLAAPSHTAGKLSNPSSGLTGYGESGIFDCC